MKKIQPLFFLLLGLVFTSGLWAQNVEFENIQPINDDQLDFSPVPYGNGFMYTSSKSDRFLKCPATNAGDYTDLFYAEKNEDGSFKERVMLKGEVNGKYNDGVPTFSPMGDKMIFTRNNTGGKNAQNIIDLKIYSADLVDGVWENLVALPFNSDDWSTAHPTLSSDGTLLIFSSNRPGSANGSMDLWGSRLENGIWSIPFNLGPEVNTDSSEIFPYLDMEGNLFFSSNGHPGEGMLDIFAATPGMGDEWIMAGNIGTEFNSPSDEVAFVPLNGATEGYLATDQSKSGAKGRDDIYYWRRTPQPMIAVIQVVDKSTGKPLPNATLDIDPTAFKSPSIQKYGPVLDRLYGEEDTPFVLEAIQVVTDDEGKTSLVVYPESNFSILAQKEGYDKESRTPTTEQLVEKPVYIIPLQRQFATLTVCAIKDTGEGPVPYAKVVVLNKRTGKKTELESDASGCITVQIDCNDDYELTADQDNSCGPKTIQLSDYGDECKTGKVRREIPLPTAAVVILEPIFYDFDRYYIRKRDARPTLDTLAVIMAKYPNLQIRLDAHADARGSTPYNDILSKNRANSAKKYLVKKGVDGARISIKDFGERQPINECSDDVQCPEQDHQLNRRVDVTPVEYDVPCLIFQTRDVKTMNVVSDRK